MSFAKASKELAQACQALAPACSSSDFISRVAISILMDKSGRNSFKNFRLSVKFSTANLFCTSVVVSPFKALRQYTSCFWIVARTRDAFNIRAGFDYLLGGIFFARSKLNEQLQNQGSATPQMPVVRRVGQSTRSPAPAF